MNIKDWISAFRLRTLPLALSSILMGGLIALSKGHFHPGIFVLSLTTTLILQILSNLANDYGDAQNGADNELRVGPVRAVQSGRITKLRMRNAIIIFSILALISGILLLFIAFQGFSTQFLLFLLLGLSAIGAAIKYTAGTNPYGYAGLGDLSVLIFFGFVGVGGSYFLYTHTFDWYILLPSYAIGALAVAVLNLNNMRDIDADTIAGKHTIPFRIGYDKAKIYHAFLIISAFVAATIFHIQSKGYHKIMFFLLMIVWFAKDLQYLMKTSKNDKIDHLLKRTALGTLVFVILYGIGLMI